MNSLKIQKTELLMVLICLFVGFLCVYAAGFKSREQAKQIVCTSHVRLNCQSVIDYAADHDGAVTFNTSGWWPCDISYSATDDLMGYGSTRQGFYCPANKTANPFDIRRWQQGLITVFPPYPVPYPYPDPEINYYSDYDESMLSLSQKQQYYRMVTYFILTDNPSGTRGSFLGTPPRDWISDLDDIANPQEYEMVVDQTISQTSSWGFYGITPGGIGDLSQVTDQTNHLNKSGYPLGGNIGYVDGHVGWRPFDQMQVRVITGPYFWW